MRWYCRVWIRWQTSIDAFADPYGDCDTTGVDFEEGNGLPVGVTRIVSDSEVCSRCVWNNGVYDVSITRVTQHTRVQIYGYIRGGSVVKLDRTGWNWSRVGVRNFCNKISLFHAFPLTKYFYTRNCQCWLSITYRIQNSNCGSSTDVCGLDPRNGRFPRNHVRLQKIPCVSWRNHYHCWTSARTEPELTHRATKVAQGTTTIQAQSAKRQ